MKPSIRNILLVSVLATFPLATPAAYAVDNKAAAPADSSGNMPSSDPQTFREQELPKTATPAVPMEEAAPSLPMTQQERAAVDEMPDEPSLLPVPATMVGNDTAGMFDGKIVVDGNGKRIAKIDRIVTDQNNEIFAVIRHGGFLGMGQKEKLVPLDQFALNDDDRAIIQGDRTALEQYKDFQKTARYRPVDNDQRLNDIQPASGR